MADESHEPRPLWVRCVARKGTKRPVAQVQIRLYACFGGCGLLYACNGLLRAVADLPASDSFLSAHALPIGLTGVCLGAGGALWSWLAIRWVDRNGTWA